MIYVIISSIVAIIVSLVYLGAVWGSFRQVSAERQTARPTADHEAASDWESASSFSWKALVSIVFSSVILYALGKSPFLWHYVPFIAIGSAIAVIIAFAIDRRKTI